MPLMALRLRDLLEAFRDSSFWVRYWNRVHRSSLAGHDWLKSCNPGCLEFLTSRTCRVAHCNAIRMCKRCLPCHSRSRGVLSPELPALMVHLATESHTQHRLVVSKISTLTQVSSPVVKMNNPIRKQEFCELEHFSSIGWRSSKWLDSNVFFIHAVCHTPGVSDLFRRYATECVFCRFSNKLHCLLVFGEYTPFDTVSSWCPVHLFPSLHRP